MENTTNMVNVNGVMRNLAWMPRSNYYNKNPKLLPKKFNNRIEQLKKLDKTTPATSYRITGEQNVPILDQGQLGSCVFNSICGSIMITENVEQNAVILLSRLFVYYNARFSMNTVSQDSGSDSATGIAALLQDGVCRETSWPYNINIFTNTPPIECYSESSNNKAGYNWLTIEGSGTDRLSAIEQALRANCPIIFGTGVDNSIFNYQPGQIMGPPDPNALVGGHELVCVSVVYAADGSRSWLIRNSWGPEWGNRGYFLMNDQWLGDANLIDGVDMLTKANQIIF